MQLPSEQPRCRHTWNQYVIRVSNGQRDALREHLTKTKIGTQIYYPVPMHEQDCFLDLGSTRGTLPETERAARETLALPIFPELRAEEQELVVARIAEFFGIEATSARHSLRGPKFLKLPQTSDAARRRAS